MNLFNLLSVYSKMPLVRGSGWEGGGSGIHYSLKI